MIKEFIIYKLPEGIKMALRDDIILGDTIEGISENNKASMLVLGALTGIRLMVRGIIVDLFKDYLRPDIVVEVDIEELETRGVVMVHVKDRVEDDVPF